jgi:hypothetical protein
VELVAGDAGCRGLGRGDPGQAGISESRRPLAGGDEVEILAKTIRGQRGGWRFLSRERTGTDDEKEGGDPTPA